MSNENSHLLEEYKELGLCWRHDDEMFSKLTAVLLPLSIAALTLPYLKAGAPKLLAAVGGLMLMTFWFLSYLIYKSRFEIRFCRIYEIERLGGFDSHLRYHRESTKNILKDQRLRSWMFGLYLVIALLVTCDIKVEAIGTEVQPTDTKAEDTLGTIDIWTTPDLCPLESWIVKLVITGETLVYLIIAAAVVWIWVWICKRDSKHSSSENKT